MLAVLRELRPGARPPSVRSRCSRYEGRRSDFGTAECEPGSCLMRTAGGGGADAAAVAATAAVLVPEIGVGAAAGVPELAVLMPDFGCRLRLDDIVPCQEAPRCFRYLIVKSLDPLYANHHTWTPIKNKPNEMKALFLYPCVFGVVNLLLHSTRRYYTSASLEFVYRKCSLDGVDIQCPLRKFEKKRIFFI